MKLEFHDCADADSGNEAQEGSVHKDLPELDDDEFIIFEPSFDDIDLNVLAARSPQSDFENSLSEPPELEDDEVFDIDPDYEMTFDSDSEDGDVFIDTSLIELAAEVNNVIFHDAEVENEDIDLMMNEVETENLVWGSGITMNSNTDPWDTSDPWSPYRTRTVPISQVYPETSMETPISQVSYNLNTDDRRAHEWSCWFCVAAGLYPDPAGQSAEVYVHEGITRSCETSVLSPELDTSVANMGRTASIVLEIF